MLTFQKTVKLTNITEWLTLLLLFPLERARTSEWEIDSFFDSAYHRDTGTSSLKCVMTTLVKIYHVKIIAKQ